MEGAHIQVLGYDELADANRTLAKRIDDRAQQEFARVAGQVADQTRETVPRKTGALAASVNARSEGGGAVVSMGEGLAYAGFVEHGGRGHPPSATGNYLYPAAMDAQPTLEAVALDAAESEIREMSWPSPG